MEVVIGELFPHILQMLFIAFDRGLHSRFSTALHKAVIHEQIEVLDFVLEPAHGFLVFLDFLLFLFLLRAVELVIVSEIELAVRLLNELVEVFLTVAHLAGLDGLLSELFNFAGAFV